MPSLATVRKKYQLWVSATRPNEKQANESERKTRRNKSISAIFDQLILFTSHVIRRKGGERNVEPIYDDPLKWIDAANSRAGRSCHSYVINCPVELGHDSNWIDYRYALRGETGGGDGSGSGGGGDGAERCRWFHSISDQIGPENQRRDWKISHGNYGRLLQLYTPKMSGTSPEIHTYTAHIGAHRVWKRVSPLFPPAILSHFDHFIYLRIINAHPRRWFQ